MVGALPSTCSHSSSNCSQVPLLGPGTLPGKMSGTREGLPIPAASPKSQPRLDLAQALLSPGSATCTGGAPGGSKSEQNRWTTSLRETRVGDSGIPLPGGPQDSQLRPAGSRPEAASPGVASPSFSCGLAVTPPEQRARWGRTHVCVQTRGAPGRHPRESILKQGLAGWSPLTRPGAGLAAEGVPAPGCSPAAQGLPLRESLLPHLQPPQPSYKL